MQHDDHVHRFTHDVYEPVADVVNDVGFHRLHACVLSHQLQGASDTNDHRNDVTGGRYLSDRNYILAVVSQANVNLIR